MIRKDYLLRMFQLLIDAMNDILNNIANGDIDIAKIKITSTYQLFDNDVTFFLNTDIDEIIQYFLKKDAEYLKKIVLLSELMYYDSCTQEEVLLEKMYLKKAIELLEYYISNTNEYSFERNNRLIEMKNKLERFQ